MRASSRGGGLDVAGLALHDGNAIEQELGDVSHGRGLAAWNTACGHLFEEVAEEEVDGGRGRKGVGASQKLRCSELAVFRLVGFGLGAGVESAELRVVGSQEHLAAAV